MNLARIAALALGATFLWAGVAKLADRRWPAAAGSFDVSSAVARVIGPIELVLGSVLVGGLAVRLAGATSIALLLAYTGVIVRKLRSGDDAPACACFGGWTVRPVSWRTVARNAALVVLAAVAAAG